MCKVVIHPTLKESRKKAIYRLVEQFGGTSLALIWGLHCNLQDHELADLGYKPLKTSDDMWAHFTGYKSPFSKRSLGSIEAVEASPSLEEWVDENWPRDAGEWPHMQ